MLCSAGDICLHKRGTAPPARVFLMDQDRRPIMTDKTERPNPETTPDELTSDERRRKIDSDVGLSPAAEQSGAAALANVGKPKASELFRE